MEELVCEKGYGRLPSAAPLANPYVPFQPEGAERYSPDYALARGTLFQGLDLPLHGEQNTPAEDFSDLDLLQAFGFSINELGLYLDTHPDDGEAVKLYNSYLEMKESYAEKLRQAGYFLFQEDSTQNGSFGWLKSPWPWDGLKEAR